MTNKNFRIFNYSFKNQNEIISPFFNTNQKTICYLADINYFKYMSVSIESYIKSNKFLDKKTEIIVITDQQNEKEFLKLSSISLDYFFTFIVIDNDVDFKKFSKWGWNKKWTGLIFCKLIVTGNSFKEFEKILFVDCDCMFLQDVSELWEIDLGNIPIAGVNDFPSINLKILSKTFTDIEKYNYEIRKELLNNLTCKIDYFYYLKNVIKVNNLEYINGGIILFNCKHTEDFSNPKSWLKDLLVLEQDMINIVFKKKKILSPIYNYPFLNHEDLCTQINCMISEEYENLWKNSFKLKKIIHFYMTQKPWESMKLRKKDLYKTWFNLAKYSIYWKEIKREIKNNDAKRRKRFFSNIFSALKFICSNISKINLNEFVDKIKT
ncbi:MAG: hypothetical protein HDR31_00755 [Mycoplasma sp.]|nr:hypothetical protein [Mycoplasma sp.]